MATINFDELRDLVRSRGGTDADEFLEITFRKAGDSTTQVDHEFANKVLTVDCPFGTVTISFDSFGQLRAIDVW